MSSSDYDQLASSLISMLDGDILPLPTFWDLERNEQRVAIAVQDATGMTPEHWAELDKPSRCPWLERTLAVMASQEKWLRSEETSEEEANDGEDQGPSPSPSYNLGELIRDLEGSESAYVANMRTTERVRSQQGGLAAHWWEIQSAILRWQPDPSRMPGIECIELICDERFGTGITLENIRRLRAELCRRHGIDLKTSNAMPLNDVLDLFYGVSTAELQAHPCPTPGEIERFYEQYTELGREPNSQKRGYAFEKFLNEFFDAHGLAPRGSFRIVGEQIDGSFEWQGFTYLVEARWRTEPANTSDLLVLRGKAEKSDWTRGLFISINGFSDLASESLRIGRKANVIAMSGHDLSLVLENHWKLPDALRAKLRHTGETGEAYAPLTELNTSSGNK